MQTQVIAHRGASADAPENTMNAFRRAHMEGAAMIEFDVRPTADGHIVVFHDETTRRFNGQPQLAGALTLHEMRQLPVGGDGVPTLDEVCAWAATTDLHLNIEIKAAGIEAAVAEIVAAHQLRERVIISSFLPGVLRALTIAAPDLPRGVLMGSHTLAPHVRLREAWPLPALRKFNARAWHPTWQLPLLDQIIPRVQRAGYAVNVWTVDDPQQMQRLLRLGVNGIITNRPALLRQVMAEWQRRGADPA